MRDTYCMDIVWDWVVGLDSDEILHLIPMSSHTNSIYIFILIYIFIFNKNILPLVKNTWILGIISS